MLERPDLSDGAIIERIRGRYGIRARELAFLSVGNDARAWAFRVCCGGEDYFLKLGKGAPRLAGLLAAHHLRGLDIANVVAPVPNKAGGLYAPLGEYSLMIFPWICGRSGWGRRLTARQLRRWGGLMRAIHEVEIVPEVARIVPQEDFATKWLDRLREVELALARGKFNSAAARRMNQIWREKQGAIDLAKARYRELAARFAARSPRCVICHADIHAANIMLDEAGEMHIVDWDEAIIAPKERDLMFFIDDGGTRAETAAFMSGYGPGRVDAVGLAFYRHDWVMQEFCDNGERVLLNSGLSAADQEFAVDEFRKLFAAGDVVERAERAYLALG